MSPTVIMVLRLLATSEYETRELRRQVNQSKRWFWQRYSLGGFYDFMDLLVDRKLVQVKQVYRRVYARDENRVNVYSLSDAGKAALVNLQGSLNR